MTNPSQLPTSQYSPGQVGLYARRHVQLPKTRGIHALQAQSRAGHCNYHKSNKRACLAISRPCTLYRHACTNSEQRKLLTDHGSSRIIGGPTNQPKSRAGRRPPLGTQLCSTNPSAFFTRRRLIIYLGTRPNLRPNWKYALGEDRTPMKHKARVMGRSRLPRPYRHPPDKPKYRDARTDPLAVHRAETHEVRHRDRHLTITTQPLG